MKSLCLAAVILALAPPRVSIADDAAPITVAPATEPAQPKAETRTGPPYHLAVNRPATIAFIVGGAIVWAGSDRLFQDTLAPKHCRLFCEDKVNPFDRIVGEHLLWDDDQLPQTLSDLAGYAVIPIVGFGGLSLLSLTGDHSEWWLDDMLVVAETTVVVGVVNRISALSFGRTRPRTRNHPVGTPEPMDRQAHESFFSGHTSAAFSMGVAAAVVADLRDYRIKGHRVAPYMWGSAVVFGTLTGYFRLAGGDHYPTDVMTGALVATGLSVLVPHLHKRNVPITVAPTAGGGQVGFATSW